MTLLPHLIGGWKRSLFGDLATYGPDGVREGAQFSFPSMK